MADTVSLVNNRNPDPANFADIVADLHSSTTVGQSVDREARVGVEQLAGDGGR